jgi:protein-L-isoaspartate(D-aspartate) O-methyltransferase
MIYGVDHINELVSFSKNNIKKLNDKNLEKSIRVYTGDGRKGFKTAAPFDIIHVGASEKIFNVLYSISRSSR